MALRSRMLSGAFWTTAGRICSVGALLATEICIGRSLSEGDCAAYFTASAFAVLLATCVVFGTPRIIIRTLKQELQRGRTGSARAAVISCYKTVGMIALVAVAIVIASGFLVPEEPKWRAVRDYSLLVGMWACCFAACQIASGVLQALDDFRSAMLVGARQGGVVANTLFLVLAMLAHHLGYLELGLALILQVTLNGLALFVAWRLIEKAFIRYETQRSTEVSPTGEHASSWPTYSIRWILEQSWPDFIVQFTSMNVVYIQVLVLGWLASDRSIADYYAVLRLVSLVQVGQLLVLATLAPFVAELLAQDRKQELERIVRGSATLIAIPTLFATLVLVLFPDGAIRLTFGEDFTAGAIALRIIAIGIAVSVISGCNSLVMVMAGRQQLLMKVSLSAFVIHLLVIVPLVQKWNIVGAAWAASVVYGVYNLYVTYLVKRHEGISTLPSHSPRAIRETVHSIFRGRHRADLPSI